MKIPKIEPIFIMAVSLASMSWYLRTAQTLSRSTRTVLSASRRSFCTEFKSPLHTDNLYPGSSLDSRFAKYDLARLKSFSTKFNGVIPMNEISFTYSLASGPGGQNVNKVCLNL